jgi:riboflavin transporter FmnP
VGVDTKGLAAGTSTAAISAAMALMPLSFSYPPIPYLKFDLAEVPVFLALLGFGPLAGFLSATVYFMALLLMGQFSPIGPLMKYAAVVSTFLGICAGAKLVNRYGRIKLALAGTLGAALRIAVMTLLNYVVLVMLFPEFLGYAVGTLSAFMGTKLDPLTTGLLLILAHTAIFNALHTVMSVALSVTVLKAVVAAGAPGPGWKPWISA